MSLGVIWLLAYLNASWLWDFVCKGSFHTLLGKHNLCCEWIMWGAQSEAFVCEPNKLLGCKFSAGDYLACLILTGFRVEAEFKETLSRRRRVTGCGLSDFCHLKELIGAIAGSGLIEFEWEPHNRSFSVISRLVIINLCALSSISGWSADSKCVIVLFEKVCIGIWNFWNAIDLIRILFLHQVNTFRRKKSCWVD